ncbi:oxidoreductase [Devosia insulae DS-56]|uniref:Oxidoreductase n=2 Tax=Devosia insulae TaxID=408174 RepID=A0A1E5XN80_9HYPH|nr:oxidoreductase [Devosia insulae DS-56]
MSKGWLKAIAETPALRDRITIVGLNDINPDAAHRLAAEFGLSRAAVESDLDALLNGTRPDLLFDVVIPGARHDVVATALEHGCHVLSEKPMATSLADARALVALAAKAGKTHAVVQNRRYIAGARRIRGLIDSGALGELTALHADFFIGAHFGGFRDVMQNVLLLDMAIHTFDAARFMSGRDALAVYCLESNPRGSWYQHGAAANAIFELAGDATFTYRGSWAAEGANTSWESQWRIIGTRGTLLWDGLDGFAAHVVAGDEGFHRPLADLAVPEPADAGQTRGHASVIADFLRAIETGTPPETVGSDNINSLAMVFAAIESARTRQRVTIAA